MQRPFVMTSATTKSPSCDCWDVYEQDCVISLMVLTGNSPVKGFPVLW